jgi:hypothetical protein
MSERKMPPDFKTEFLSKYLGATNEVRKEHYRALPLPHFKPMSHAAFLNALASGGHSMPSYFGYACLPGEDIGDYHGWTMFFFHRTQGGVWDGTGILVRYGTGNNEGRGPLSDKPITGEFAICKHEKVPTGTHYEGMRGWHPGYCKHCGLDLTVDSGD